MKTLLEIDAGNTFVKWRKWHGNLVVDQQQLLTKDVRDQGIEYTRQWSDVEAVTLVSVAGTEVNEQLYQVLKPLGVNCLDVVVSDQFLGLKNGYEQPAQMGADRWVAMISAWKTFNGAFCVVDAGSAITVDLVDVTGQHLGGYILPGLAMLRRSLLGQTAQVRWQSAAEYQSHALGRSTAECVEHGCRYQLAALMHQIERDCEQAQIANLVLTGGDAALLSPWLKNAQIMPNLVLDGLKYFRG